MKVELQGKIIRIGETQTFDSGFQKREFVLEIESGEYPNQVPVEAVKDKVEYLDKFAEGDEVECTAFLNGNYWEKGDRYFLALRMSYIKGVEWVKGEPVTQDVTPADEGEESGDFPF